MEIASKNRLRSLAEEVNAYAANERRYTNAAVTMTMSKFGPSGSLKKKNSALEHTRDVIPRSSNEVLFELNISVRYIQSNSKRAMDVAGWISGTTLEPY